MAANEALMLERRVPIPRTLRTIWPGSQHAGALTTGADVAVTAWLRPKRGGELDAARAQLLGATPPLNRTYAERKTLVQETACDPADVEQLRAYCESFGLRIVASHWRSVQIGGPIERLVDAFGATVAIFSDAGGARFRHRSGSLHAPATIAEIVWGVFGLHQWPRSRRLGALQRHATPLMAGEVCARYDFPDSDGAGQTIAVVQFRGEFKPDDFGACMHAQGVSASQPIVKRVDDAALAHERETTKDLEAALDSQVIGALAPAARIVIYDAPDDERGFLDAIRTAIFDTECRPTILSISYGWPEHRWTPAALAILNELFVAAALLGISVFCSSGDNGAELDDDGKPHVLAPASSPFVHACGATQIVDDSGSERECAWEKTGGGFSEQFALPQWQSAAVDGAVPVPAQTGRGVPDMAAQEQPGYCVYLDGVELAMGGTSAVAPMFSALTARLNARLGVRAGFFLPLLYGSHENILRDISEGSNGFFNARAGWNPCTGLGVPGGRALETALRGSANP